MSVEKIAVIKIEEMLLKCAHLDALIDTNDKTLLTDGHIDIYSSDKRTKKTFIGRVPVQVKGRTSPNNKLKTFSISQTDLEGYLRMSGVLYFVVTVNKKSDERTAYYALLNPFKINRLLQTPGSKKPIPVAMRKLHPNPESIENLVRLAYRTQNESPETGWDPRLFEHIKNFTLHTDRPWNMDSPLVLTGEEMDYSLVIRTDSGMSLPVDWTVKIMPASYAGETTDWTVCSGEHCFQSPIRRRTDDDSYEIQLSEGLKLVFKRSENSYSASISLTMRDSLSERRRDIGFLVSCLEQSLTINGRELTHAVDRLEGEEDLRAHYRYLDRLHGLLSMLGVNTDLISLPEIADRQNEQLSGLYDVLVNGKEMTQDIDRPGRVLQPIGRWGIELLCLEGSEEGKWRCLNLFDREIGQQFAMSVEDKPGEYESFLVTPYEMLDLEQLPYTLNLNLRNVVEAYAALPETPKTRGLANQMVLRLLKACDAVELRKKEFLEAAERLNEWLIPQEADQPHHLVNRWQIIARTRDLSDEERAEIRTLRRTAGRTNAPHSTQIEAACSILLGDAEEVESCLAELSAPHLEAMRSWPIWSLWARGDQDHPASAEAGALEEQTASPH